MVTTNARDSKPRESLGNQTRWNDNNKPKISRENGSNNEASVQEKKESRPTNRSAVGNNKANKSTGEYNKNRDFKGVSFNKDDDYENDNNYGKGYGKGKDQRDSRSKSGQMKEQQSDKYETLKRLEKEKKIKQKKMDQEFSGKLERPNKPMIKHRRTNNIDWTKGYEKGLFDDDDELYTEYM